MGPEPESSKERLYRGALLQASLEFCHQMSLRIVEEGLL